MNSREIVRSLVEAKLNEGHGDIPSDIHQHLTTKSSGGKGTDYSPYDHHYDKSSDTHTYSVAGDNYEYKTPPGHHPAGPQASEWFRSSTGSRNTRVGDHDKMRTHLAAKG
jgi:hypothetical protein